LLHTKNCVFINVTQHNMIFVQTKFERYVPELCEFIVMYNYAATMQVTRARSVGRPP